MSKFENVSVAVAGNVYFEGKKTEIIPTSQLDFEETYYQKEPYENKLPEINKTQINTKYT